MNRANQNARIHGAHAFAWNRQVTQPNDRARLRGLHFRTNPNFSLHAFLRSSTSMLCTPILYAHVDILSLPEGAALGRFLESSGQIPVPGSLGMLGRNLYG